MQQKPSSSSTLSTRPYAPINARVMLSDMLLTLKVPQFNKPQAGEKTVCSLNFARASTGRGLETLGVSLADELVRVNLVDPESEGKYILVGTSRGNPLAAVTALVLRFRYHVDVEVTFSKKESKAKSHETKDDFWGRSFDADQKIIVIHPVITDGNSVVRTLENLKFARVGTVAGIVVGVDARDLVSKAKQARLSVPIFPVLTIGELLDTAKSTRYFSASEVKMIQATMGA